MAWNTEETRSKLKEAAVVEFAEHGLAGARIERISARAGINKERIYKYFGTKEDLFALVLSEELAKIASEVPLVGPDPDDIGEYAGRCFDYHLAHPQLVRLLHWEALELPGDARVPDEQIRAAEYAAKVASVAAEQQAGRIVPDIDARDLLFIVMATAAWWVAVPQVARMVTGRDAAARGELRRRRASVVSAARHLATHAE